MKAIDCVQGSDQWKEVKAGKVSASRMNDVMAKIKSGEAAARRDYRAELLIERLTGKPSEDGYTNSLMQWGTDTEPLARIAYELQYDVTVGQVGFVIHPTIEMAGASPDGIVGEYRLVEIKCPKSATHLGYILDGRVPSQYVNQMQWQMACTGATECDFVSYDPRMPEHLQLFVVRCKRDEKAIAEMEDEVMRFLVELDAMLNILKKVEVLA